MNVQIYFSPESLSNSYIVSQDNKKEAILIDPKRVDLPLFEILDSQGKELKAVLFTHVDKVGLQAVRTLERIYSFEVFGGSDSLDACTITNIKSVPVFDCAGFAIRPFFIPGHLPDSIAFHIDNFLFPGELFSAGMVHNADQGYGRALLIQCIQESFFELANTTLVLPAFGPPSTLSIERRCNPDLQQKIY